VKPYYNFSVVHPFPSSLENNDCGEGPVCYFAQPFRSGGKYPTGVERRNGLKIKPWFK